MVELPADSPPELAALLEQPPSSPYGQSGGKYTVRHCLYLVFPLRSWLRQCLSLRPFQSQHGRLLASLTVHDGPNRLPLSAPAHAVELAAAQLEPVAHLRLSTVPRRGSDAGTSWDCWGRWAVETKAVELAGAVSLGAAAGGGSGGGSGWALAVWIRGRIPAAALAAALARQVGTPDPSVRSVLCVRNDDGSAGAPPPEPQTRHASLGAMCELHADFGFRVSGRVPGDDQWAAGLRAAARSAPPPQSRDSTPALSPFAVGCSSTARPAAAPSHAPLLRGGERYFESRTQPLSPPALADQVAAYANGLRDRQCVMAVDGTPGPPPPRSAGSVGSVCIGQTSEIKTMVCVVTITDAPSVCVVVCIEQSQVSTSTASWRTAGTDSLSRCGPLLLLLLRLGHRHHLVHRTQNTNESRPPWPSSSFHVLTPQQT